MKNILDGKEINHYCNTEYGSSDSPILSLSSFKVISKYNKEKTTKEIIIKYKIGKEDKLRIFGDDFVKNNKGNFQMVINNINYELNSFYKIKN